MVEPTPPEPGKYRLFDRVLGPLPAGSYELSIEQNLGIAGHVGTASRHFDVTGPRWALEPSDVHALYPPRNEQDATTECYVPFITLQRRTLPWERTIFKSGENVDTYLNNSNWNNDDNRKFPWVSLLLFTEDELTNNGRLGVFKGGEALCLGTQTTIDGVAEDGIFEHWSQTERRDFGISAEMDSMKVDAIKVPSSTLRRVAPKLEEVLLLSHARQVNPLDKERCGTDEDGWFSIVMGNRVLNPSTTYHACLVSLEGRLSDKVLPGLIAGTSQSHTRLVLLHHWTFKSSDIPGDFQNRVESLNVRLRSSTDPAESEGDLIPLSDVIPQKHEIEPLLLGTESTPGMTANSYLSTEMVHNDGIVEDVLYRGPLIAYPENHYLKPEAYAVSDAALALVQELGMWDISHSSAFELGRLLALSDASFTKAMKQWVALDIKAKLREEQEVVIRSRKLDRESLESNLVDMTQMSKIRKVVSPAFRLEDENIQSLNMNDSKNGTESDEQLSNLYHQNISNHSGGGNSG